MDAAHLSQTLQLVATERGLDAFVTLGRRTPGRSPHEPLFAPYVPRETKL